MGTRFVGGILGTVAGSCGIICALVTAVMAANEETAYGMPYLVFSSLFNFFLIASLTSFLAGFAFERRA